MKDKELKEVMTSGEAVEYRGMRYNHVSAVIYRKSGTGIFLQVELMDRNHNSVVLARPTEVMRLGNEEAV